VKEGTGEIISRIADLIGRVSILLRTSTVKIQQDKNGVITYDGQNQQHYSKCCVCAVPGILLLEANLSY
jgi:monoamine oxidase